MSFVIFVIFVIQNNNELCDLCVYVVQTVEILGTLALIDMVVGRFADPLLLATTKVGKIELCSSKVSHTT